MSRRIDPMNIVKIWILRIKYKQLYTLLSFIRPWSGVIFIMRSCYGCILVVELVRVKKKKKKTSSEWFDIWQFTLLTIPISLRVPRHRSGHITTNANDGSARFRMITIHSFLLIYFVFSFVIKRYRQTFNDPNNLFFEYWKWILKNVLGEFLSRVNSVVLQFHLNQWGYYGSFKLAMVLVSGQTIVRTFYRGKKQVKKIVLKRFKPK